MNKITSIYTQEDENTVINESDVEDFSTVSHLTDVEITPVSTSSPRLVTPHELADKSPDEQESSSSEIANMKVGERLRYARDKKNLSIQHISDRLYLSPSVIQALETDDYDSLPSAVFVRGYLRNYAKLLEISPELVIEGYEQQLGRQLPSAIVPAGESPAQPPQGQATANHFWVKAMTFTIITALMILLSVTIVSQDLFSKRTDPTTTTVQIPLQPAPDPNSGLPEDPVNPAFTPPPAGSNATSPSGTEVAITPTGNPPPAAAETPAPPATETMTIYLKQRSWLEVTDSTNKKVHNSIASANSNVAVTGTPPFRVKVGNVDGVSVEYKGEKNPITSYNKQPNANRTYIVGEGTATDLQ